MPRITEGGLVFDFPQGWQAVHFDETAFHRRFQKMQDGIKALDIIAIAPNGVCWLMEIKDYRLISPNIQCVNKNLFLYFLGIMIE